MQHGVSALRWWSMKANSALADYQLRTHSLAPLARETQHAARLYEGCVEASLCLPQISSGTSAAAAEADSFCQGDPPLSSDHRKFPRRGVGVGVARPTRLHGTTGDESAHLRCVSARGACGVIVSLGHVGYRSRRGRSCNHGDRCVAGDSVHHRARGVELHQPPVHVLLHFKQPQ